ncbi:predicted protein [Nematostella vectensis]|uniref:Nuclear protein MDM1 n=1 Tax=Nematostella vectensis TaxID=45351 RepID=A7S3D8_NEMVE|nr:nuclear protein MDM1 [Nematostella vectensis]EDO41705.1 predicted protein [Nematostella vectensis]|eukprot:XP_001633768.1 predicted protein [Nematostella vectensis]
MPVPRSRSKRYNSEYQTHYKKFDSKRPITVKGEVTRTISPVDMQSIRSTPRAGLQSTKLGIIHEPPLQRKRIVPYEKNHNIFPTGTVKEVPDQVWLADDVSSVSSYSPPKHKHSSKSNGHHHNSRHKSESAKEPPILKAERKLLASTSPTRSANYPYVSDRIPRKSTYTQDFADGRKSKVKERRAKSASPIRKPKEKVGGCKQGITPDRMPAAGIRTVTSMGDARLIKPSDNSDYMRSPEMKQHRRAFDTEYKSRFKLVHGTWVESPEKQERPSPVGPSDINRGWYQEAISRRDEAYGYAHRERGTHFSHKELDRQNRLQAKAQRDEDSFSSRSESIHSQEHSPNKRKTRGKHTNGQRKNGSETAPPRREAWNKRPASPESEYSTTTYGGTETTEDEGPNFLERGRSPTPELREAGQARRHHYDVTTNILNDKLQKSLTFSDEKRKQQNRPSKNKHRKSSPHNSVSDGGSYGPPPNSRGNRKRDDRDDDVMSEVSMASRASAACETLDRARKRRDEFWAKKDYSKTQ